MEDMIMVKDKDYLKLFSHGAEDTLTEAELSEIIDEELSKSEEEMDTELIESCLDAINRLKNDTQKGVGTNVQVKKNRRRKWITAAAVAAVLAITLSIRFTVQKPDIGLSNQEIYSALEENGCSSIHLPSAMLTNDCKVISIKTEEAETSLNSYGDIYQNAKVIKVLFDYKGKECSLTVEKSRRTANEKEVDSFELSGVTVEFFESGGGYIAVYKAGGNYYTFRLPVSLSQVREFFNDIE